MSPGSYKKLSNSAKNKWWDLFLYSKCFKSHSTLLLDPPALLILMLQILLGLFADTTEVPLEVKDAQTPLIFLSFSPCCPIPVKGKSPTGVC
jgi:hypothetical protein